MALGEILAGAGQLLGTVMSPFQQAAQNRENRALASDNWDRSDASAREQMAFQERMRNTAHQAQVNDLKAAGLNPILSANSGAATPSGAMASGTAAQAEEVGEGMAANFAALREMQQRIKMNEAQMDQMKKQGALADAQTKKTNVEAKVAEKEIPKSEIINQGYRLFKKKVLEPMENLFNNNSAKDIMPKPTHEFNPSTRRYELKGPR